MLYFQVGFPFKQHDIESDVQKPKTATINATVEILVWTDFSFFKSFQRLHDDGRETDREILRYIATLVNAVSPTTRIKSFWQISDHKDNFISNVNSTPSQ